MELIRFALRLLANNGPHSERHAVKAGAALDALVAEVGRLRIIEADRRLLHADRQEARSAATKLDYGVGHGFVVYVRHEDDQGIGAGGIYGVYEERRAAERKVAAINRRIEQAESSEVAWAYVVPLEWANTPADRIVEGAIRV